MIHTIQYICKAKSSTFVYISYVWSTTLWLCTVLYTYSFLPVLYTFHNILLYTSNLTRILHLYLIAISTLYPTVILCSTVLLNSSIQSLTCQHTELYFTFLCSNLIYLTPVLSIYAVLCVPYIYPMLIYPIYPYECIVQCIMYMSLFHCSTLYIYPSTQYTV